MSLTRIKNELRNHGDMKALALQAEKGDVTAQLYLGICYKFGIQRPIDSTEAIRLLTRAAESGNTLAECCLGICYLEMGDLRYIDQGLQLLNAAAEKGDEDAQVFLGFLYLYDYSPVPKDISKAVYFLEMAASQNNLFCKMVLADIHLMPGSDGSLQDQKEICNVSDARETAKWYGLAIENGFDDASRHLWSLFERYPTDPEIMYRAAMGCDSIEAKQAVNNLAIKQPDIFDELAVADSLSDLKEILSPDSFHIVEKRRQHYALAIKNELSVCTPLPQDLYPGVIENLLPASDVMSFFKKPSQNRDQNQGGQRESLEHGALHCHPGI